MSRRFQFSAFPTLKRFKLIQEAELTVIDLSGDDAFSGSYNKHYPLGTEFIRTLRTNNGDWVMRPVGCGKALFVDKDRIEELFGKEKPLTLLHEATWRIEDETENS